ncbi:MAG: HAD hydrolase family protein [Crocinitomicaceae bacterium]|jgi:3-deoxy-D-manno-octulosonate 8-phosphate phosphatase (KDO 8-P phosphatase)|nr:HAD hydrolase family protein [Crocinitomicaceae bacterium]MDG1657085.1 HAD hydrolase family protein [Crocinitomicaceae bacterium]MDG2440821.1 HAD hydrolase family protein [Crocinitomicaceae bacterium]|tara:strand:+ start:553 stop:1071 length:519 start_codon:yes stop_codon:yes gene_type:complete
MTSYKENLANITTFIFDVDGVLTNGDILLMKEDIVRSLNSRDGYALQYAVKKGYKVLIITGGASEQVRTRLESLGVTEVRLRSSNKLNVYGELKAKYQFTDDQVLYMGDDIPDYEVMRKVGIATCPQDAAVEIKAISDYHSPFNGGRHCVRDVIEQTLRAKKDWFTEGSLEW